MEQSRRYELVRNIASGGMAQVYEATLIGPSPGFKRRVALKRMLPQHSHDRSMQSMFFDEARVVSQLHHGNIVQVIDFGVVDECQFIAMEFVDGIDAGQALKRAEAMAEHMPEGVALHVVSEAAHALDYAHNCRDENDDLLGIIHRDISPHNILLSWRGDVKLGDFGIALSRERSELTRTGIIKGKLHYMPPEQAFGERLTTAVDVFAIGVTLQVLIVGSTGLPVDPGVCVVSSNLSPAVAELVSDCTQKDPRRRPDAATVAERAGRLAAEALGRGGRSGLSEWLEPLREPTARQSKLDDLMGLSLVMVGPNRFTVSSDRGVKGGSKTLPPLEARPTEPSGEQLETSTSDSAAAAYGSVATAGEGRPPRLPTGMIIASLLLGAVVVVGIAFWPTERPISNGTTLATATDSTNATPAATVAPDVGVVVAADLSPDSPAEDDAAIKDAGRPDLPGKAITRRTPRKGRSRRLKPPTKKVLPTPVASKKEGWIQIGGSLLSFRGRITIDGKNYKYAPRHVLVPVGPHKVVVYDKESTRKLLDVSVVVSEQHTRNNALRLIRRLPSEQ